MAFVTIRNQPQSSTFTKTKGEVLLDLGLNNEAKVNTPVMIPRRPQMCTRVQLWAAGRPGPAGLTTGHGR